MIEFYVPGRPQSQGSKTKGRWGNIMEDNKELGPWRERVALAAYAALQQSGSVPFGTKDPISLHCEFVLYRPIGLPKTKPTPPAIKVPDADKAARAIMDALKHVIYPDDKQVTDLQARKRVAEIGENPGVHIRVTRDSTIW